MRPLKLPNILRRDIDRPTLKQRAAALKARAAKVLRRPSPDTDNSRRVMMAGSLAVALPLPVVAATASVGPHPDQAVFDAEAEVLRAERAYDAAREAGVVAYQLAHAELGICPSAILMTVEEANELVSPFARREIRACRSFHWVKASEDDENHSGRAWTPDGLEIAIRFAVPVFGWGGTTPKRIRRYREIRSLVESFDTRRAEIRSRHRVEDLLKVERDAGRAMSAARSALDQLTATTPAGLAVLARHLASYDCERVEKGWLSLLRSAARVGGVDLVSPAERRVRIAFM